MIMPIHNSMFSYFDIVKNDKIYIFKLLTKTK